MSGASNLYGLSEKATRKKNLSFAGKQLINSGRKTVRNIINGGINNNVSGGPEVDVLSSVGPPQRNLQQKGIECTHDANDPVNSPYTYTSI